MRSSAVLLCVGEGIRCSQREKILIWENEPKVIMKRENIAMTDRTPSLMCLVAMQNAARWALLPERL